MSDEQTSRIVEECKGMSDDGIIAAYHAEYYEETKPHIRKAFEELGISEHEVSAWIYKNIK